MGLFTLLYEGNGKKYIGQKMFIKYYWKYYLGSGTLITQAIKKYGKDNFKRKIIAIAYSCEELDILEIKFIKYYNAVSSKEYYNLSHGGGATMAGLCHKKEAKDRISKAHKGNKYALGNHHTEEAKKQMSIIHTGVNNPNFGKHLSDRHKQKISRGNRGKIFTKEHKFEIGKGNRGKIFTEERKHNISESKKGKFRGAESPNAKKVICVTTGEIFECMLSVSDKYPNINVCVVSQCCRKVQKSAGKLEDGTPMQWQYYDDYLKNINMEIYNRLTSVKKVICLTTNEVFNSLKEAGEKYNISPSGISGCCTSRQKSAGKDLITNEPLRWQYYSEYIKSNPLPTAI